MTQYGITSVGFIPKPQQEIIAEINASLQSVFGNNINLGPESVFGQIVGIFSEREALIWLLGEAIYASQYPSGAEGTSVDNILELNNLLRLPASPTVTEPVPLTNPNGTVFYGLPLYGTPGTLVPAGSIIQTNFSPVLNFTLNADVTINAAVNAIQTVFFSQASTSGSWSLFLTDILGNTNSTVGNLDFSALAVSSGYSFATTPIGGAYEIVLTQAGVALTTTSLAYNAPATGGGSVQAAINALSGYGGVSVTGSYTTGFEINWGTGIANPIVTFTANTTSVVLTAVDSVQAAVNNILDSSASNYPFTDVQVTTSSNAFILNFGAGTPVGANPSTSAVQIPKIAQNTNTLMNGIIVTNIQTVNTTLGNPALGIGNATCTVTGPNFVPANSLTVIGSPLAGWASVNNQLDCITGTNVEDDTQALIRRSELLAANANGPLQSIVDKVRQVSGVTAVKGFQNVWGAALQVITWASIPSSGNYTLTINGFTTGSLAFNASAGAIQTALQLIPFFATALVSGNYQYGFTIDFNGSNGGQAITLGSVTSNTTGVVATQTYGRAPNSYEIVVIAPPSSYLNIAKAIYGSAPAGIGSYFNPIDSVPNVSGGQTVELFDSEGTPVFINFTIAQQVEMFVDITLLTDTYNVPGDSSSGVNPNALFNPDSIGTIQQDIVNIGNATPIGGLIIGFGTDGLIGAFNSVEGIIFYTLAFGNTSTPSTNTNFQLLSEQAPLFETFNVIISYT